MKTIWINNDALLDILTEQGIELICNDNMDINVSDEDAARIPAIVAEYAPAAEHDYGYVDEMMDDLVDSIDFTEEEYNERVEGMDDVASFNDFLANIISSVRDNNGSLEDAVAIANDAFSNL